MVPATRHTLPAPTYQEGWVGAFFDVDNTLVPGPSIEVLFFRHLWSLGVVGFRHIRESARYLLQRLPPFSLAPLRRRKLYLVGLRPGFIEPLAEEFVQSTICPRLSIRGESVLTRHQQAGHHVVLISGSPDFLVKPLAKVLGVSMVQAARLHATEEEGYTGHVYAPLPYGPGKRRLLEQLASRYRWDLTRCYAYGDSPGDVQALQLVGHPLVVNPIRGMGRLARHNGWPVTQWA